MEDKMKRTVKQQFNLSGKNTLCRGGLAFLIAVMLIRDENVVIKIEGATTVEDHQALKAYFE
jgi:hypothetical protein